MQSRTTGARQTRRSRVSADPPTAKLVVQWLARRRRRVLSTDSFVIAREIGPSALPSTDDDDAKSSCRGFRGFAARRELLEEHMHSTLMVFRKHILHATHRAPPAGAFRGAIVRYHLNGAQERGRTDAMPRVAPLPPPAPRECCMAALAARRGADFRRFLDA
ncbi:hypothetical protein DENSPDRAFT_929726 [Dentipellis sp. KUC8613]|nr:hypothetical protein DENSPDRAFT_929726 [Dentipellis sp. KUC8613]